MFITKLNFVYNGGISWAGRWIAYRRTWNMLQRRYCWVLALMLACIVWKFLLNRNATHNWLWHRVSIYGCPGQWGAHTKNHLRFESKGYESCWIFVDRVLTIIGIRLPQYHSHSHVCGLRLRTISIASVVQNFLGGRRLTGQFNIDLSADVHPCSQPEVHTIGAVNELLNSTAVIPSRTSQMQ